jgi:NAD(P)H-hydrate epimerase
MRSAGEAVAAETRRRIRGDRVAVLCGPGNNGGDGFVAAALLRTSGCVVRVFAALPVESLSGDVRAASQWAGPVHPLDRMALDGADAVIDALFGAGLTRPLTGPAAELAAASHAYEGPIVAADVPSGLHGDLGAPLGGLCFRADATVTFFRKKPAHVLEPGRSRCGEIVVADIGIPDSVLPQLGVNTWENAPGLWREDFPWPETETHKHRRGRLAILCGPPLATGAARLAIAGGRRAGAGFTTLFGSESALRVAAQHETGAVLKPVGRGVEMADAIHSFGAHAAILGPGAGVNPATRDCVLALLAEGPALVLDADALTVFANAPDALFAALRPDCVLTPHEGEFARLFPDLGAGSGSKIDRARSAAARANCVVLLKGPDTVIAAPDGRAAVNTETSPFLASAGTGDVLAGIVGGLLAQAMPAFEAACAGAFLHGRAARAIGPGLIAEDLPGALPAILRALREERPSISAAVPIGE